MWEWYRALIRLRHELGPLNDGDLGHIQVRFDEAKRWMEIERGGTDCGRVRVLANLGGEEVSFAAAEGFRVELASHVGIGIAAGRIVLPPDTLAVLSGEAE